MMEILFEVFGTAQPAGSKRAFGFRRGDGSVGATVVDANPKSRPWKTLVSETAARVYSGPLLEGPLSVELVFEMPRPQGHFGKRGLLPSAPAHPTVRPDVLKLARAVEDALTGVLYQDDSQIVHEVLVKRYGERARLVVTVRRPLAYAEASPLSGREQPSLIPAESSR
jgi:Holliday junction resolvase RusA-like endonuclease